MRRAWFQDSDGTYRRNCPLIMAELDRVSSILLPWRYIALNREWWQAYREGVIRADRIGRFDRVAEPAPFREAYPDNPELWILDELIPHREDNPPVECRHTEPGSPCDWNICRQPERLTAGDRGTDPARTRVVADPLPRTAAEHCRPGRCLGLMCCSYECSRGRCPSVHHATEDPTT